MPLPTYYSAGSASVDHDGTLITFVATLLGTAEAPNFLAGDLFCDPAQPAIPPQRIASIDYDASTATLAVGWPGTTMVGAAYEVRYVGDIVRSTSQTRLYLEMLGRLRALGIQPDAFGQFADRDAYDDQAKGFIFLSLDGDGDTNTKWTLYIKKGATSGVWDDGQIIEGVEGPPGASGEPLVANIMSGDGVAEGSYLLAAWVHAAATLTRLKATVQVGTGTAQIAVLVNGSPKLGPYVVSAGAVLSEEISLVLAQDDRVEVAVLTVSGDVKWLMVQMDAGEE